MGYGGRAGDLLKRFANTPAIEFEPPCPITPNGAAEKSPPIKDGLPPLSRIARAQSTVRLRLNSMARLLVGGPDTAPIG